VLGLPIVSGNVSLYNQTPDGPILPTPVVGTVGLIEDRARTVPMRWQPGDQVWLLGDPGIGPSSLAGAEIAWQRGVLGGEPGIDLAAGARLVELLLRLADDDLLSGAHDLSTGGLACGLARLAIASGIGAELRLPAGADTWPTAVAFGERPGRVLVAIQSRSADRVRAAAAAAEIPAAMLGTVRAGELSVAWAGGVLAASLDELAGAWETPF
jgi:phosphoribosylformylglycinamidine synthase